MSQKKLSITYHEYTDFSELPQTDQELIDAVIQFAQNAYAPYSKFKVSAALRLKTGEIIKAANVENASYPVSICAEQNLLAHTASNYPGGTIVDLAVYVDKLLPHPVPPCGMCRQALIEAESRQRGPIRLIMVGKDGKVIVFDRCTDLLPFTFTSAYLD